MRDLRTPFVFALVLAPIAACGGGSSDTPDAAVPDAPVDSAPPPDMTPDGPQFDFSCMGNAAPADGTASDPIAVTGTVSDINLVAQMLEPVPGATVLGVVTGGTPDSTTTDGTGAFALSLMTGTNPIDAYLEVSKTLHHSMRVYPPSPLTADLSMVPALLLSESNFQTLVMFTGATQSTNNGTVGLAILDCNNQPIDGAVPSLAQNGSDLGITPIDGSAVQPGLFIFFDVPPGVTTVGATFNGTALRAHDIDVVATTLSTTRCPSCAEAFEST